MSLLKYALIGCGRISPNHIEAAKNNSDHLNIVALADINQSAMDEKIQKFNLSPSIRTYTDYREMLERESPDLVAIATPSGLHATIALDALAAGAHVIIEKPIALSIHDANLIIAAGRKAGRLVCANHQNRFNKSIQYIRKALIAGRFGRLLHGAAHVRWNRGESYYNQASWRGTWSQDGGALMNQCIHNIDLLRWLMGCEGSNGSGSSGSGSGGSESRNGMSSNIVASNGIPTADILPPVDIDKQKKPAQSASDVIEVFAYTDQLIHPYLEAEDLGLALVRFTNGSYGLIEGTTNIYPKNLEETLYLFGERGTVKAGGTSDNIIETWSFSDHYGPASDRIDDPETVKSLFSENPPNIYGFGHTPLYANVVAAIEGKERLLVTGEEGKKALELVLAIYKSAAEHRPVKLPLDESVSTLDFIGRFDKK